ncbi:MAG: WD40 repeat domain-containing protein [Parachlamydiaceae bacterium]|nr:WD40 repeat domain-containing protein [Parachlamydiaceae bacterium]
MNPLLSNFHLPRSPCTEENKEESPIVRFRGRNVHQRETPLSSSKRKMTYPDRFIRSCVGEKSELRAFKFNNNVSLGKCNEWDRALACSLTGISSKDLDSALLSPNHTELDMSISNIERHWADKKMKPKHVKEHPPTLIKCSIFDIQDIEKNFYLNILNISKNNVCAVGLGNQVSLMDLATKEVNSFVLNEEEDEAVNVTSLCWLDNADLLAVGTELGDVEIWNSLVLDSPLIINTNSQCKINTIVQLDENTLAAGAQSGRIFIIDFNDLSIKSTLKHDNSQCVCGLAISVNGKYLASGGNDNKVKIWNTSFEETCLISSLESHTAGIKALAWNPIPEKGSLLATGGGLKDKTIKLWSAIKGQELISVPVQDAVTGLHWLVDGNYLVSTHGTVGLPGTVQLWRCFRVNGVYKLEEIPISSTNSISPHTNRILYSTLSSDGKLLLTAAADERLVVWNINSPKVLDRQNNKKNSSIFDATIR